MRPLSFGFIAGIVFAANVANCQSNLVLFISAPGDYIGGGHTYVTEVQSGFSVSGTPATITVSAFGFYFTFAGPGGANLAVGTYTNSARYPFNGSNPGLDISGNGNGCDAECGSFQVLEIHTGGSGQVDRLWITYSNSCECSLAPMTGDIRYNSELAPPIPAPRTIRVPADYPTIQAAINAASVLTSDTVLVSPGVYNESVNFNGKAALLVSAKGPAQTFINDLTFSSGETSISVVSGFTITNGGISVSLSSPTIISNWIVNCGTGVNSFFSSPNVLHNVITGCSGNGVYLGGAASAVIQGNTIQKNGGGISMNSSGSPTIINNLIQSNQGDAIGMINDSDANIVQNIIFNNGGNGISSAPPYGTPGPFILNNTISGNGGAGIYISNEDSETEIINNIIEGNPALAIVLYNSSITNLPVVQNNDLYSSNGHIFGGVMTNLAGIGGNITTNPLFACLPTGDFHLLAGSPCIDAGRNGGVLLPTLDFEGNPRILAGNTNLPVAVDMGAYEFNPASPPTACVYLNCPANVVVTAVVGQNSAAVNYPAPDATPTAAVTCMPASGSVFPAGTNAVVCTLVYGTNTLTGTFTVTVQVPPYITNQASIIPVLANSKVTMTVDALGTAPMSYQWSFGGAAIAGATSSTLTVSNAQSTNEGYYQVTLANNVGTAMSLPMLLRVLPSKALIVSGPVPVSAPAGSQAVFNATVIGSAPLAFQWYKDGALQIGRAHV